MLAEFTGLKLDFDRMAEDDWTIHFLAGTWTYNNVRRIIEPGVINLKNEQYKELEVYDIFYDEVFNNYKVNERLPGEENDPNSELFWRDNLVYMGGFLINNTTMRYMFPTKEYSTEDDYLRAFTDAYNGGYLESGVLEGNDLYGSTCQPYNSDFSKDFMYDCLSLSELAASSIGGSDGTQFLIDGNLLIPYTTNLEL